MMPILTGERNLCRKKEERILLQLIIHTMKSTLIALAAFVSCSFASQAYEAERYDSTFSAGVDGVFGWADRSNTPRIGGGLLTLSSYTDTAGVFHQFSLTSGALTGSRKISCPVEGCPDGSHKSRLTAVPLMFGYNLNLPVSESVIFYLGGKIGVSFNSAKLYEPDAEEDIRHSGCDFAWSVNGGVKIAIGERTDLKLGYEYFTFDPGKTLPFHTIQLGISYNF